MRLGAIAVVLALGAGAASAQSLGEIARRERERRGTLTQHSPVLTNEDFQRRRILEPVREAIREDAAQPATPVAEPVVEAQVAAPVQVSLGEYARQLREQKAARQRQQEEVRVAAAPTPVPQSEPAPVIATSTDRVRFRDTTGRPISLGQYARQLREDRIVRESAPQIAVNQAPAPAPARSVETPRVSLGEYARRLQDARKARRMESVEAGVEVAASVVGVQRGDTLWKLSAFYLGRGELWATIWRANPQLANPNLIHPGQLLRLPESTQLARSASPRPPVTTNVSAPSANAIQFYGCWDMNCRASLANSSGFSSAAAWPPPAIVAISPCSTRVAISRA